MYGSQTDKWHSQNGDEPGNRDEWSLPARTWVRTQEREAVLKDAVREYQDYQDEQACATDGIDPTAYDPPLAEWEYDLLNAGCANGAHPLHEVGLLPDGCKRMACDRNCGYTTELHPPVYGCETSRKARERKEQEMDVYQGIGEQVEVQITRPPVDRKKIEMLLSRKQPLTSSGNNPFARPTEEVRLFDPTNRTKKGMKVG